MTNQKYDHRKVEKYWQEVWEKTKIYSPDINNYKNKFYNLWMFPYPSGEGLHAGHAFASTGSDVYGRFMRMSGKQVFQPMVGYDSFGIHAENYALKIDEHPMVMLERVTKRYGKQMKTLGHSYDWMRSVTTSDPDYYKWTQWLFVKMFKAGLAYRKKVEVNYCPSCKTVLSDEQVMSPAQAGKEAINKEGTILESSKGIRVCERCGTVVERKELEQWMFRITNYADRLLENLNKINWPDKVKTGQRNWIGKKSGALLTFNIDNLPFGIDVFTTRPDTLYGSTFLVVSPKYAKENLLKYISGNINDSLTKYINSNINKSFTDYMLETKKHLPKTGLDTGLKAINPANKNKIPIFVSDYVLDEYGTGAIMGVPAHDQRDWEFAKKYKLKVVEVIEGGDVLKEAFLGNGRIINSDTWNGLTYPDDLIKILSDIESMGCGKASFQYHLRDWLISRQRYWGTPIPMIFCKECSSKGISWFDSNRSDGILYKDQSDWDNAGWWPVDEKDLPVELPNISDYKPKGGGRGPLDDHPEFYIVKCPNCHHKARRETDVADTFLDSSWYFLRYPNVGTGEVGKKGQDKLNRAGLLPWSPEVTKNWLPVDLYFGGAEHTVLHLMYARFVTMSLYDMGYLSFEEPFPWFFAHGLMIRNGAKMSKSRGNVVNPDEYIEKYGADTLRLYLMFMGPMDGYPDFRDTGIEGMRKFVERVWHLFEDVSAQLTLDNRQLDVKMHKTIKKVTNDIKEFKYNTAISAIMEYVNALKAQTQNADVNTFGKQSLDTKQNPSIKSHNVSETEAEGIRSNIYLKTLVLLLSPFTPHLAEEVFQQYFVGDSDFCSIHFQPWPAYDPKLVIEKTITIPIQVNGKLCGTVEIEKDKEKDKEYVSNLAKTDIKVSKWLESKRILKEIYIEGRLINFVV